MEPQLSETIYLDFTTHRFDTGVATDDDATPTVAVFEETNDTPILTPTAVKRTALTGQYRVPVVVTDGNGFEIGKSYSVVVTATVNSIVGKAVIANFQVRAVSSSIYGSAAISVVASSFTKAGAEPETGTYANTTQLDGVLHVVEDDGGTTDVYYEFSVGGSGVPVSVSWNGYAKGNSATYDVFAYNFGTSQWEQVGTLVTSNSDTILAAAFDLTNSHVGTGANLGKVRFRIYSTDGTEFGCDRILCSYAVVAQSVGYADGSIWVDTNGSNTNTESYVDGTADNPVSTWAAALTLAGNLGLSRFHIINGSSITLSGDSTNYTLIGDNWTLDLNGQVIADANFYGASISGIGTGTGWEFHHCLLAVGGTLTVAAGFAIDCGLSGDLVMSAAGTYYFDQCFSGVAGTATPSIDFGAAIGDENLNFRHYSGGIEIKNMGQAGTDKMSLEGDGQLVINANCAGGTVAIRGSFTVTDNASAAVTLSDDARYDLDQVTAGVDAADIATGTKQDTMETTLNAIPTTPMRGTDGANTVTPDAAGTAAALHVITDAAIAVLPTVTPDPAGTAAALHAITDAAVAALTTDLTLARKLLQNRKEFDLTNSKMYLWNDAGAAREYEATMTDDDGAAVDADTQGPINLSRWTVI